MLKKYAVAGAVDITRLCCLQDVVGRGVRSETQQLLNDHQAANAKLKTLAEKKNLALSQSPTPTPPAPTAGDFDSQYGRPDCRRGVRGELAKQPRSHIQVTFAVGLPFGERRCRAFAAHQLFLTPYQLESRWYAAAPMLESVCRPALVELYPGAPPCATRVAHPVPRDPSRTGEPWRTFRRASPLRSHGA